MAEILGLGLSHYPGPSVPVEYWASMLERNVEIGRVAPELYADRSRWPAAMRAEYGDDEGLAAAKAHRARLLAGYAKLRAELDAFHPDIVLIWGDDQYENFKRECIPAFCIGVVDQVIGKPFAGSLGPFKTRTNAWHLPPDTEMRVRGYPQAASALIEALLDEGFDVAYLMETRHGAGLAHSFNNTILYLDYDRRGFDYPIIPFHVNCYGRQMMNIAAGAHGEGRDIVSPPAPTPRRCFDIGRATARFFAASPWRVALVASSSWSHGSLTAKHGRLYPDLDADRKRYDDLKNGRFTRWGELTRDEIDDAGQSEILNWVCLAGAMTELGRKIEVVDFVETYVFNSSKCFALSRPESGARREAARGQAAPAPAAG
jgi:hypothetical protein